MVKGLKNYFLIGIAAAVLTACAPRIDTRGNLPDPDLLDSVEVGQVNRQDVISILGSPSMLSTFSDSTWYYVSERTRAVAFFEPKTVERKVIRIDFDDRGLVSAINTYGLEDGQDIEMVARTTPTAGKELNLLQQLFGNIGRFEDGGGSRSLLP